MTDKDDLDTIFVAIDRLQTWAYDWRNEAKTSDLALAHRANNALARIRERLANSVPVEQAKMEGME